MTPTPPGDGSRAGEPYDLVVIGAGIHGSYAAWDAALRGLRVALIDRGDFGGATSSNSMKILHGGLRYLQSADLIRLRESVRERASVIAAAPNLTASLPCALPTSGRSARSRTAMRLALAASDALAAAVRRGRPWWSPPRGQVLSAKAYREFAGEFALDTPDGAALWYDAIMQSPERILLGVVRAAQAAGAHVANHTEATSLLVSHGRVHGVIARSHGRELEMRSRLVLNAAGRWAMQLAPVRDRIRLGAHALAFNVVVRRQGPQGAVAVPHPDERRMLFAVPWRDHLILGTGYRLLDPSRDDGWIDGDDVERLLSAFNRALPRLRLDRTEIRLVHAGAVPAHDALAPDGSVIQRDRPTFIDHAEDGGPAGLITMSGVKWTTARRVAEQAIDLCQANLGQQPTPSRTAFRPIEGSCHGAIADGQVPGSRAGSTRLGAAIEQLYGSLTRELEELVERRPDLGEPLHPTSPTLRVQVIHAVRREMARHLTDVVLRRAEMGTTGHPGAADARAAASLMGEELGWSPDRVDQEIASLDAACAVPPPPPPSPTVRRAPAVTTPTR